MKLEQIVSYRTWSPLLCLEFLAAELWVSACTRFPALGLQVCTAMLGFYMSSGDPNPGLYAWTANSLTLNFFRHTLLPFFQDEVEITV